MNPFADEALGRPAYDSLTAVEETLNVVDVFRPSDEVAGIVDEVLDRDDVDVIWLQLGIYDGDAVARAEASGRRVVQNRCMKPETGDSSPRPERATPPSRGAPVL